MSVGTISDSEAVDNALHEWRRKAANVFMAASAVGFLPGVLVQLLIQDRSYPYTIFDCTYLNYALLVLCAVFYKVDHRIRVWMMLASGQFLSLISGAAATDSPFLRILPIAQSLTALVLLGRNSGRVITVSSSVVLLASPFIVVVPGVPQLLQIHPGLGKPASVLLREGIVLTTALICLMVLVERFHGFLIHSLASERRAAADLKHEAEHRKALERELARIGDDERRRLGQEVHDGVCQQLTGALLRCQALERRIGRGGTISEEDLGALSLLLEEGIDEAHTVAKGLCPLELVPDALRPALKALTKRIQTAAALECDFAVEGDVSTPDPAVAQHLYRIAQEALSNAARHSGASRILVRLSGSNDELRLLVEDNGSGLPDKLPTDRMGLRTMSYRAQMMEGHLEVEPLHGGGTRVSCRVPKLHRQSRKAKNA